MKKKTLDEMSDKEKIEAGFCPNCDIEMQPGGGCFRCPECGFSLCKSG